MSTVFGLIRDIQDRRTAAKVRDAKRNFLTSPDEAIAEVNKFDPDEALALRQFNEKRMAEQHTRATKSADTEQTRYRTALTGVAQSLRSVRDAGKDVGAAYTQLTPVFKNGFGMRDEEIAEWGQKITQDPAVLDALVQSLSEPEEFAVASPGSTVYGKNTGTEKFRVPSAPKTLTVKRADGGSDVLVMDAEGNFVQSGASAPATPGVTGTGTYGGPRTVNPQARGVRNNNAGNIKDGPWAQRQPGYAGSDGTFARFNSAEAGVAAQERLLGSSYVNGVRNVDQIVNKYLGGADNKENSGASQENYKAYVAGRLGIARNAPVPPQMLGQLGQAMREFENGGQVTSGGAGPAPAYSTPGKGAEGWRDLDENEKKQRGLEPTRAYQIGISGANTGKIIAVDGKGRTGTTGKAGKPAGISMAAHTMAVSDLSRLRDEARAIRRHPSFSQSTGSIQGRLPSVLQGSKEFDTRLGSYKDSAVINALRSMKAASPNGASGFGSLQLKEGERLENFRGSLSQTSPDNLLRTLRQDENDAMVSLGLLYNIPPDATMFLIRNPKLRGDFDKKYGVGLSKKILGS